MNEDDVIITIKPISPTRVEIIQTDLAHRLRFPFKTEEAIEPFWFPVEKNPYHY